MYFLGFPLPFELIAVIQPNLPCSIRLGTWFETCVRVVSPHALLIRLWRHSSVSRLLHENTVNTYTFSNEVGNNCTHRNFHLDRIGSFMIPLALEIIKTVEGDKEKVLPRYLVSLFTENITKLLIRLPHTIAWKLGDTVCPPGGLQSIFCISPTKHKSGKNWKTINLLIKKASSDISGKRFRRFFACYLHFWETRELFSFFFCL